MWDVSEMSYKILKMSTLEYGLDKLKDFDISENVWNKSRFLLQAKPINLQMSEWMLWIQLPDA